MKFISITYLIYILGYEMFIIGGCSYIVFEKGHTPYWFLLAILLSCGVFKPKDWSELMGKDNKSSERTIE